MSSLDAYPGYAGVPFAELAAVDRGAQGSFGPADRIDPYWSMMWSSSHGGPIIDWRSLHVDEQIRDAGISFSRQRKAPRRTPQDAIALLGRRNPRIDYLATINLWRMVSGEHLAALRGQPSLNASRSDDVDVLYDAGLIQRGRALYAGQYLPDYPEFFRPSPDAASTFPDMRYAQWLGATLGGSGINGHQYSRHNLLATELSLRAAEMCPLHSVLGESASEWSRVFHPDLSPNQYRASDAVWLRQDGLKIAVELTAAASPAAQTKINQFADLIARDPSKSVIVVFVMAPDISSDRASELSRVIRRAIKQSSRSSMNRVLTNVASRISIVRWSDWFPSPGLVSKEFVGLRARRCLDGENWSEVDLLDPFQVPFDGADSPETQQTLDNVEMVRGAPHWMCRRPAADSFSGLIRERAGL